MEFSLVAAKSFSGLELNFLVSTGEDLNRTSSNRLNTIQRQRLTRLNRSLMPGHVIQLFFYFSVLLKDPFRFCLTYFSLLSRVKEEGTRKRNKRFYLPSFLQLFPFFDLISFPVHIFSFRFLLLIFLAD